MFKNFKNKKAASLMMVMGYSIILLGLSGILIGMLISSQRSIGISENYNMAIYGAESGIEQSIYEIHVHDIGFNDNTSKIGLTQNGSIFTDGFLKLNGTRLKYKWGVKGLDENNTETGYLVWNGNINYDYLKSDKNIKYYKNFRKFYMFKDIGGIGENSNITNICQTDSTIVSLTTTGSNIYTDSDSSKKNTVQWRLNFNEIDKDGTGYYLEANATCKGNHKDPFCYTNVKTNYLLQFNSTENKGNCFNSFGDECHKQDIVQMLTDDDNPILSGNHPYKPEITLSYQNKLFETGDLEKKGIPIKYKISGCNDNFPSLVQEITSTAQVYGSVQKISTKIYQGNQGIDLSYTVIQ